MSVRSFSSVSKNFASTGGQTHIQVLVSLPTPSFSTPRLLWRFMVFQTRILPGVGWMGSPLLELASAWDLLWCLGLLANSQVLLNPLPR
jgi:hypothetical protein